MIVERRGGWLINFITSFIIINCINRFTRREPLEFERNTGYTLGSQINFRKAGANKSNICDILT